MDPQEYERFFPTNPNPEINICWIDVAQAKLFSCLGADHRYGSGVIIKATINQANPNEWEVEVLTALHILADRAFQLSTFRATGFTSFGPGSFLPGQNALIDPLFGYSCYINNEFRIDQVQIHPELDLCLFIGQCPSHIGFQLNPSIPIFQGNASLINQKKITLIHYPRGKRDQAITRGIMDVTDSQSHLLLRINQDEIVEIDGQRYGVSDRNRGVLVDVNMVNELRSRPIIFL